MANTLRATPVDELWKQGRGCSRPGHHCPRAGFSLVEILVATVLLMLLSGAMILNFSVFGEATKFAEQTRRFETLLRFARGEAASRGRTVRLIFEPAGMDGEENRRLSRAGGDGKPGLRVRVEVVADPFAEGESRSMPLENLPWAADAFYEVLSLESMRSLTEDETLDFYGFGFHAEAAGRGDAGGWSDAGGWDDGEESGPPAIQFYPDGSSDSAEMVLATVGTKPPRREVLRLIGMTGTIVHRPLHQGGEPARVDRDENRERSALRDNDSRDATVPQPSLRPGSERSAGPQDRGALLPRRGRQEIPAPPRRAR